MLKPKDVFFDFNEFSIGTAEYPEGPTGCTVIHFENPVLAAIDVRGGSPGVRESDSLRFTSTDPVLDALVFAGGSTYGLAAADGVMSELLKKKNGSVDFNHIPQVPAAVVYDYYQRAQSTLYPDRELGIQAFVNAKKNSIKTGRVGAGANVSCGKFWGREFSEISGQVAGYLEFEGMKFFALVILNPVGNILNYNGDIVAGSLNPSTREHVGFKEGHQNLKQIGSKNQINQGNTTLSALITNVKLSHAELQRLTIMIHTSMARVIDPFHTPYDGDVCFGVTTGSYAVTEIQKKITPLLASQCLLDSIISGFENGVIG
jgi:L-aminopeptidase/D-esterase-like protein